MRRLIVTENASLDGVISPIGDWFDPTVADDEQMEVNAEHTAAYDALVLGRVTYEEFAGFWPEQEDDQTGITDELNRVQKYVATSTLESADWVNTEILRGPIEAELDALKRADGKDIVITGSVSLVHALQPSGLIDVYRFFVYPVVAGEGRRAFATPVGVELADVRRFPSGVVLLEYNAP